MSGKREIRLYGAIGRQFGRVHRLVVATAGEAVRALCANFPGFEQALSAAGATYRVTIGDRELTEAEQINDPSGTREVIRIVPVVAGGKSKWLGVLLGVALVAAAFFTGGATLGAAGITFSGLTGQIAFSIGASLVIGGVAQMLAPQPKYAAGSDAEQKPSYVFNGPVNMSQQGMPVPIGYGRMIVGSAVLSQGIYTVDIPV